jgi:hypothetical protein
VPSRFLCRACGLRFTVGWLHDAALEDGYGAIARLVCRGCGTEHMVRVALRSRGSERISRYDLSLSSLDEAQREIAVKILQSRFDMSREETEAALDSLPLVIARGVDGALARELAVTFSPVAAVSVTEVDSIPNVAHGPLRRDRFFSAGSPRTSDDELPFSEVVPRGPFLGPNHEFELDTQACTHCGVTGMLVGDDESIGETCPHCGAASVECVERHDEHAE